MSLQTTSPLTTKQLVFIWLLGGLIEWVLQYVNRLVWPLTATENLPYEAAFGGACAVAYVFWRWPSIFHFSTTRTNGVDAVAGILLGYLVANITAGIIGISEIRDDWVSTTQSKKAAFLIVAVAIPIVEELVYRGVILASLLQRNSAISAVAITSVAAMVMHDAWLPAVIAQILFSSLYLVRRRSLPASMIAHAVANAAMFAPSALVVLRYRATS